MLNRQPVLIFLALLLCTLLCATVLHAQQPYEKKPSPYNLNFYTGFSDAESLLARRVIQEVMKKLGYSVTYHQEAFRRSIIQANRHGDAELIRVESITEIDADITNNLVRVPEPTIFTTVRVASNNQALTLQTLSDLSPFRNGVEVGIRYLEANVPNVITRDDISKLEELAQHNKLDTIAYVSLISRQKPGLSEIYTERLPVYTYMHRKHKKLVPLIADGLRDIRISGRYQELKNEILKYYPPAP